MQNLSIQPANPSASASAQAGNRTGKLRQLREMTREFEALYLQEVYKSMRKNVPDNGLFKQSYSTRMFQEMLDAELARSAAEGKGMGIGEAMFDQLEETVP